MFAWLTWSLVMTRVVHRSVGLAVAAGFTVYTFGSMLTLYVLGFNVEALSEPAGSL